MDGIASAVLIHSNLTRGLGIHYPLFKIKSMFKQGRWIATLIYLGSMGATLYVAIGVSRLPVYMYPFPLSLPPFRPPTFVGSVSAPLLTPKPMSPGSLHR